MVKHGQSFGLCQAETGEVQEIAMYPMYPMYSMYPASNWGMYPTSISQKQEAQLTDRKAAWAVNPGIAQLLSVDHWLLSMGFFSRFQDEKGVAKLKTQEIKRYTCRVYSYMV